MTKVHIPESRNARAWELPGREQGIQHVLFVRGSLKYLLACYLTQLSALFYHKQNLPNNSVSAIPYLHFVQLDSIPTT